MPENHDHGQISAQTSTRTAQEPNMASSTRTMASSTRTLDHYRCQGLRSTLRVFEPASKFGAEYGRCSDASLPFAPPC
ncbi:hypothetical protein DOTSEDRAFT_148181 [Dothistroma septosporum NZE10]|uniref:Uncharacterized protein n=1 Tax=Dothistroma septosporum (strain NZE10 / CBS 128990) TaxID=675120 RepID=N1PTA4_DOTSN|nr:hypothetical protein DOTSEDRAFT_148181 [Dothistroma septosporum NZE10]